MFITPLILKPLGNREWEVAQTFIVESKLAGIISVPKGFISDLNSIPRFLWWASTPADYPEAAVVHDAAYRGFLPRNVADKVYAEILTYQGMDSARVATRYMALRLFGWHAYGK